MIRFVAQRTSSSSTEALNGSRVRDSGASGSTPCIDTLVDRDSSTMRVGDTCQEVMNHERRSNDAMGTGRRSDAAAVRVKEKIDGGGWRPIIPADRTTYDEGDQLSFHRSSAPCISRAMSSFACFFALSVMPSSASSSSGDVLSGSNSSTCPSLVCTETRAENDGPTTKGSSSEEGGRSPTALPFHICESDSTSVICEADREWPPCELDTDTPRSDEEDAERMTMLGCFFNVFPPHAAGPCPCPARWITSISGASGSPSATALNQFLRSSWYGLARGEPFTLSMCSFLRGQRGCCAAVGRTGLNVDVDGTREAGRAA